MLDSHTVWNGVAGRPRNSTDAPCRLSPIGITAPISVPSDRVPCYVHTRTVDKSHHPRRERERTVVFYYSLTRGFGTVHPIMRTHNARTMRKYGGSFSPLALRRSERTIEEYVKYSLPPVSLFLSFFISILWTMGREDMERRIFFQETDSIMRIIRKRYKCF